MKSVVSFLGGAASVPARKAMWRAALAAVFCTSVLVGCGGGSGGGVSVDSPPNNTGIVTGRITSARDSAPVQGAKVSLGGSSATTGADGKFELREVAAAARAVVRINASGFGEGFALAAVANDTTTTVDAQLEPVGIQTTVNAGSDSIVSVPGSSARLSLSGNSLVRPDGSAASGNVTVALTPISPANNVNAMPGDYQTTRSGGGTASMESWGALNIGLTDANGQKLNLGAGKTASIRIAVSTRSPNLPSTIPLFFFDENTGYWVQQGSANLAGVAPNQYYEGTVSHFSVWNADQELDTVFVTGCVVTNINGVLNRAANVRISSDGIDYSGATSALTNGEGSFTIAIKRNGLASLLGVREAQITNTVVPSPSDGNSALQDCLLLSDSSNAVNIKLTWGLRPTDLDAHLFAPDGTQIYFSNKGSLTQAPFINLDVDDLESYGPEVITVTKLMVGTYTYAVNNYNEVYDVGMTASPARVEFQRLGSTRVFTPGPGERVGLDWWTPFSFTVDAQCNITSVTSLNFWSGSPSVPSSVPRQYCVRP